MLTVQLAVGVRGTLVGSGVYFMHLPAKLTFVPLRLPFALRCCIAALPNGGARPGVDNENTADRSLRTPQGKSGSARSPAGAQPVARLARSSTFSLPGMLVWAGIQ